VQPLRITILYDHGEKARTRVSDYLGSAQIS
jgi:hypothetical protein